MQCRILLAHDPNIRNASLTRATSAFVIWNYQIIYVDLDLPNNLCHHNEVRRKLCLEILTSVIQPVSLLLEVEHHEFKDKFERSIFEILIETYFYLIFGKFAKHYERIHR